MDFIFDIKRPACCMRPWRSSNPITGNTTMKTVTERELANPVPKVSMILTGDIPAMRPAVIPATATTSMALSRKAKPTTTIATASKTHMVRSSRVLGCCGVTLEATGPSEGVSTQKTC